MDKGLYKKLVISIIALASDSKTQIEFTHPGCVLCDLFDDFDSYASHFFKDNSFNEWQRQKITQINKAIDSILADKPECFDKSILDSDKWVQLRKIAKETLHSFNIKMTELPKSVETEPGVWKVDTDRIILQNID